MRDTVYINQLKCECVIGVWEWEKSTKQTLTLDIEMATDASLAATEDDLSKALDYQAISQSVQKFASENQFQLIETMAVRLAELILSEFDTPWVRLKIDKGQAVKGVKNVGVVVERGVR